MSSVRWAVVPIVVTLTITAACSPRPSAPAATSEADTPPPDAPVVSTTQEPSRTPDPTLSPADATTMVGVELQMMSSPPGCDPLDTRQCILPFPSDATTVADDTSTTGRRVAFPEHGLPTNSAGVAWVPDVWNLDDGFSANTPILTWVGELDASASNLPSWTDLGASLADGASVVLVEVGTSERVPLWAETDPEASGPDGELLVVHPAISLEPATTYAIGLRNLVATDGSPL